MKMFECSDSLVQTYLEVSSPERGLTAHCRTENAAEAAKTICKGCVLGTRDCEGPVEKLEDVPGQLFIFGVLEAR